MKKRAVAWSCVSVALVAVACTSSEAIKGDQVCFRDHCKAVEVVMSPEAIRQGLMHREHLAQDTGMLFVFPTRSRHAFWMKNTLIPLDMIWMDASRRVVHIETHVPPCRTTPCPSYKPDAAALYVLEINAGETKKWGLTVGEQLRFTINPRIPE